jgi:hypothetical protein
MDDQLGTTVEEDQQLLEVLGELRRINRERAALHEDLEILYETQSSLEGQIREKEVERHKLFEQHKKLLQGLK